MEPSMDGAAANNGAADIARLNEMATAISQPIVNTVIAPLLKAEADLLNDMERAAAEWLVRRREAVADAQRLAESMAANGEPGAVLQAQRDWLAGAFRRLTAEVAAWQTFTVQSARTWLPLAESAMESIAAATHAAGKPPHAASTKG
jgi:hypothetical protein